MQARRLPARQGVAWVIAGYRLFRANPPLLTIISFVYLMAAMLMLAIPAGIGGLLFPIIQPMLILAVANGCRGIATTNQLNQQKMRTPPDLLAGIRTQRRLLMQLGALQLAASILIMLIVFVVDIKPDPAKPDEMLQTVALVTALSAPILMAFWFAPLLTGWHQIPPLKSVFFSLVAGLRNWRAFLVYGLTLGAIILLPAMLAIFAMQVSESFGQVLAKVVEVLMVVLLIPIFLAGNYVSYRDIFTVESASTDE